ncbi:MAG TPA: hypothetical protein VF532_19585 [Candidatus Angelobacter sp.]
MTVMTDEKRVMFEIYRDADDLGRFRVVYFTELGEHEKELEIAAAFRGEHVFDGFILTRDRFQAKSAINSILDRLNQGERVDGSEIELALRPFMP